MAGKVKIGIIGAGGFANVHMEHFRKIPEAEIIAFCRRDPKALEDMRRKWDVPSGFTDYRKMLESPDVDAVDIITPTDAHKGIALDAIAAGKHVLCDKPLALTATDANEMLEAAEKAGVIHSTNFNQRGNTAVGRLKRYLDRGFIGEIRHASLWWGMSTAQEDSSPLSWRFVAERGGGVVHELIHIFDMVRFIGGDVARICAKLETHMKWRTFPDAPDGIDITVPDSAAYIIEWKKGGYAVAHASFASKGKNPDGSTHARIEVSGDNGRLETTGRYGLSGISGVNGPIGMLEPGPPYPQPYELFVSAVMNKDQSKVETSFYEGVKAAELVDAAYESSRTDAWVAI